MTQDDVIEAVMSYLEGLQNGSIDPPEEYVQYGEAFRQAIEQAVAFRVKLGVTDHGMVEAVIEVLGQHGPSMVDAAMTHRGIATMQ